MQVGFLNLFPVCAKHSLPLVTWIAVLWHNVFNRIILDNDWSFVPKVFKVAENEVSGTHIVNVTGHKCLLKFLIIRELFIVIAQHEEGLNRIHIIISLDFITQRRKRLIKRIRRNVADASTKYIADAHFDNLNKIIFRNNTLCAIVMHFEQERECYFHAKIAYI